MDADKILVLDNGELVGNGTHEQLLERSEVYQKFIFPKVVICIKKVGKNMRNFQGQLLIKVDETRQRWGKLKCSRNCNADMELYGLPKSCSYVCYISSRCYYFTWIIRSLFYGGHYRSIYCTERFKWYSKNVCMLLIAIYGVTVLLTWLQTFVMINVALKQFKKYDKIFLRKSKRFLYGSLMCVPKVI